MTHEVWLTGYGLLSALGETAEAWWAALAGAEGRGGAADSETYAPFHVYPVADYDLALQVPKRGDRRAMGEMMRHGAHACGLALAAAGVAGDEDLLARMVLLAAAGGGERDFEVDAQALALLDSDAATEESTAAALNRLLSDELRPTLFLAQLPNLFAGNISIIHGVSGATRTFMGEESAGIDAFRIAYERAAAGQGELFLVGGAFNACRPDLHVMYDAAGLLMTTPLTGLWERPEAGICLGSAGAFFVIETAEHARARGARPLARVAGVLSERSTRAPGAAAAVAGAQLAQFRDRLQPGRLAVMSGTCGSGPLGREEHGVLEALAKSGLDCAVRGTGMALGHTVEAAFLANVILGVSCLERGAVFPPLAPDDPLEARVPEMAVAQVLVTGWGHIRGEGMALLEAVEDVEAGDG